MLGLRKPSLATAVTISGAVVLFATWMIERQVDEIVAERERLKRSQLVIDIEEQGARMLERDLIGLPMDSSNARSFEQAWLKYHLACSRMKLLSWQTLRTIDRESAFDSIRDLRDLYVVAGRKALSMGRLGVVDSMYVGASYLFQRDYMRLDEKFGAKFDDLNSAGVRWQGLFDWLYTIGSCLLGMGYLMERKIVRLVRTRNTGKR
jgi:hypothetical protein